MKKVCLWLICLILAVTASCAGKKFKASSAQKLDLPADELIRKSNAVFVGEFVEATEVSEYAFENRFRVKEDIGGTLKDAEVYVYACFGDLENDMDHYKKGKEYLLVTHYYEQIFRKHTLFVLNAEMVRDEETGRFTGKDMGLFALPTDQALFSHIKEVFWSVDRTEQVMPPYTVELHIKGLESEGDRDYNANTYFVTVNRVYTGDEAAVAELMKVKGYLYAVIEKGLAEPGKDYVLTMRQTDEGSLVFVQEELGKVFLKDSAEAQQYLKEKGL